MTSPPSISSLTAAPLTVPAGASSTISGQLHFTDPDGDVDLIAITVVLPDGSSQDIPAADVQGVAGMSEGDLTWAVILNPPSAGRYDLELSLIDAGDNESNVLTTTITVQ